MGNRWELEDLENGPFSWGGGGACRVVVRFYLPKKHSLTSDFVTN